MWYIWKRALLHKLILQTLSLNTVSCLWFWERHHLFNIYVSWDTCLRNRVAELFVTYKDLMCNGIQGIVLRRLSCSWSIEPRKKAVYNTDFNFNIHKILPELFLGTIPTGFFDLYCWKRSTPELFCGFCCIGGWRWRTTRSPLLLCLMAGLSCFELTSE